MLENKEIPFMVMAQLKEIIIYITDNYSVDR